MTLPAHGVMLGEVTQLFWKVTVTGPEAAGNSSGLPFPGCCAAVSDVLIQEIRSSITELIPARKISGTFLVGGWPDELKD